MHPLIVAVAFLLNGLLWYGAIGLVAYLNGGGIGRHPVFFPFQCFWEEIVMLRPGGAAAHMKKYVHEMFDAGVRGGFISAGGRLWSYNELINADDPEVWQRCAVAKHGSWVARFAETTFSILWLLWPAYLLFI